MWNLEIHIFDINENATFLTKVGKIHCFFK